MHRKRLVCVTVAAVVAGMSVAAGIAVAAGSLVGAGSTLIAPLMARWQSDFQNRTGTSITYGAVGSGTGIQDISSRSVDFGASDAPLTGSQAGACNGCVQIPWALTATAIGFHVNGVRSLKLTGSVLAKIYLGQITKWNARPIKNLNKHAHLPSLKITPVYRSDGSGDTYAFTDYMSRVSNQFKHRIGNATAVSFPTGVGGKGNSGVTAIVSSTDGAIGYIAASYLIANGVPAVALKNNAGNFEYPNLSNIENAAKAVTKVPNNNELHIVDPPATFSSAYPLSTFSYAIVPKSSSNASLLAQFIHYAVSTGQKFGASLDFAALPKVVAKASNKTANQLHG